MGDDDGYDMSQLSTGGNRKRKREEAIRNMTEQAHAMYGDELLDYFLLSRNAQPAQRPEPPTNFQPDWIIDSEQHTALHWAAAMGDMEVIKQLKRFGASLDARNIKGETPLIRAVYFTNCYEKLTFQQVARALFDTVACRDNSGCTVIHHAASMKNGRVQSHSCARHYLDIILNRLQETHEPEFVQQLIDAQDNMGNTALHLAAQAKARKCIRALLGRGASTDIPNNEGVRAEDLIRELNSHRKERQPQRSSSPFAPDSQRHTSFRDVELGKPLVGPSAQPAFRSQAAQTVQSRVQALVVQKFADLAASYEEEWRDKDEAEKEAQRILDNTRHELANVRALLAEAEQSLDPPDVAANTAAQVDRARQEVLALVTRQSRIAVQEEVEASLLAAKSRQANGEGEAMDGLEGPGGSGHGAGDDGGEDSLEDRLRLAHELAALVEEQRRAEVELVDAMSLVGTGDQIDRYRELLRKCLDPRDAESLDANLDSLIEMMEEDGGAGASTGADAASGAVPLQGGSAVPPMLAGGGAAEVGMLPPHHHSSAMEVSMVG